MENIKQIKVNEELHDIEDAQARQGILDLGKKTDKQIEQISNDLTQKTNQLKENLINVNNTKADKSDLAKTNLYLDALYKLNRGQTYDVLEQESEAYSVDIPSGSRYMGIDKVGGKSLVFAQLCRFLVGASVEAYGVTLTAKDEITIILNGTCTTSDWTYRITELLKGGFTPLKEKNLLAIGGNNGISFSVIQDVGIRTSFTEGVTYSNYEISLNLIDRDKIGLTDEEIKEVLSLPIPYNEGEIVSSQIDRVDVRGRNLFDNTKVTVGKYIADGGAVLNNKLLAMIDKIKCKGGDTFTISGLVKVPNANWNISYWNGDTYKHRTLYGTLMQTFTIPDDCDGFIATIWNSDISNIQIEKGTTATAYSPYSLQQITTGFPILNSAGSVYDYIDLNEGKLHQRVGVVDLGTLDWQKYANISNNVYYANIRDMSTSHAKALCSKFVWHAWDDLSKLGNGMFQTHPSLSIAYFCSEAHTDATTFKNAMNGVMLYYELAEEVITDITIPTELSDWLAVEVGGSITFHNTDEGKRLLIPNKETFIRKLDEVRA